MGFIRNLISGSLVGAGLLLFLLASCSKRDPSALDRLQPCSASEGPADAYCGTYEVWENRQEKAGRRIPLKIVVLPALKQRYASEPLFVLSGGPGQGAAESAKTAEEQFRWIQAGRDIVLVDLRGTGKSNPLECKAVGNSNGSQNKSAGALVDRFRACLKEYEGRADVTKYTTDIAMDDLDDVRQFLGYQKINLYGVSYGTRAAMVYARRHPDRTRAVVLDSVAPITFRVPLYVARDSQRALDLLIEDCGKSADCIARFPNLRRRLEHLLASLETNPQHIRQPDPLTGIMRDVEIKRLTITTTILAALESSTSASLIPLLVEQGENGNLAGFIALRDALERSVSDGVAQGLYYSVVCSEDAPQIEPGAIQREAAGTFLGPEFAELKLKPCEFWPRARLEAEYFQNAGADVPALILSGELDPLTRPSWGEQVATQWRNSRHIVVPGSGHGTIGAAGVIKLIGQFLESGKTSGLDTSFLQRLHRPPFYLGLSGPTRPPELLQ